MAEYKKGQTRCRLHYMTRLVTNVSEIQKSFLKDTPFETFLSMKPYNTSDIFHQQLTWWLVSKVDVKEGVLKLGRKDFNIEASVPKLLGLPQMGGSRSFEPIRRITKFGYNDPKFLELRCRFTNSYTGRSLLGARALNDVEHLEDRELFCQYFVILSLCFYLAPNTTDTINLGYLTNVCGIDSIKDFDWSKFVARYLIDGIKDFRQKTGDILCGCVHILHLIYFDYKRGTWNVRSDVPLLHVMNESDLVALEPDEEGDDGPSQDEVNEAENVSTNSQSQKNESDLVGLNPDEEGDDGPSQDQVNEADYISANSQSRENEPQFFLKLLVDKKEQRVLYAEATKDTVDFLSSLLTLPVATIVKALSKDSLAGSVGNLYSSVEKKVLLKLPQAAASTELYRCRRFRYENCYNNVTKESGTLCPECNSKMNVVIKLVGPSVPSSGGGEAAAVMSYIVMDDLKVAPMSTISGIMLLNSLGITDIGMLQEKIVELGYAEGMHSHCTLNKC